MDLFWTFLPYVIAVTCVSLAFGGGWCLALRRARRTARDLEGRVRGWRKEIDVATGRASRAERELEALWATVRELPEIAQRLTSTQEIRQIPDLALDLVHELFAPVYSVFLLQARGDLVVARARGTETYKQGQRLEAEQGIPGWAASKQMLLTPEDIAEETAIERARHLGSRRIEDFEVCIPILRERSTLGVILIGPTQRRVPHAREIARTIALITSVALTSSKQLSKQTTLAQTDGLTGLSNKTRVTEVLEKLLEAQEPGQRPVSVFLFDIDHFKTYNDTHGHHAGDELLRSLGQLLTESIREGELVGRFGGEEFLVILPGTSKAEALAAANRICSRIAGWPFAFRDTQPGGRVSISGGVATFPLDERRAERLIQKADEALYRAKAGGRNRVMAYASPELGPEESPPDA